MTRSLLTATLLAGLLISASLATAQPIRPGDDLLDTTLIRSTVDSLAIYVVDGDSVVPVGRLIVNTVVEEGGTITREEEFLGFDGERVTFEQLVVADGTLAPTRFSSAGLENVEHLFGDGEVAIRHDDAEAVTTPLGAPVFHGKSLDLLLMSIPLRMGLEVQAVILDEESVAEHVVDIEVTRLAAVRSAEGNTHQTFEVRVDFGEDADIYHLDVETGALIRYEATSAGVVMMRW